MGNFCNHYIRGALVAISFYSPAVYAGWSAPVTISSSISDQPDIAIDNTGHIVAAWQGFDGANYVVQSATSLNGQDWTAPVTLSETGQDAQDPTIGIDLTGTAVAAWSRFDGNNSIVQGSVHPLGGIWSLPVNISESGANAGSPELSVNSKGLLSKTQLVWHRFNGFNFMSQAATLSPSGTWSMPFIVSPSGLDALIPEVAVNAAGDGVLVYCQYDGQETYMTRSASILAGQEWSPCTMISTLGQTATYPIVAIDNAGNAMATWSEFDGSNYVIKAATLPYAGSWSSTVSLSAPGQDAFLPQAVFDSTGRAQVTWIRFDGNNYIAQTSTLSTLGNWSAPVNLSEAGQNVFHLALKTDVAGNTLAVWDRTDGTNSVIQAARLSTTGGWSAPTDISAAGQYAYTPELDVDAAGNAMAIWLQSDGGEPLVATARFTP